ncbi:MAG TPA: Z1 domain-containing protein [Candidatus Limnocylindria bacterium]|nr:Z1 domain-containing protein [Candidatus Limnocylindria bacterium]
MSEFDINKFKGAAVEHASFRYEDNLKALKGRGLWTQGLEQAVEGSIKNISHEATRSFVIYGEPQSGKTGMMIALTARLLDDGHKMIIVLLNDSVQLLEQNLERFARSGLDPAPKRFAEIMDPSVEPHKGNWVIFSKKNASDLKKLLSRIDTIPARVVIDDEADYASPNAKINQNEKTKINALVEKLIGKDGIYIGVTATPARLDLNNTFENDNEKWVDFPPHPLYTGQDAFFPTDKAHSGDIDSLDYHLVLLPEDHDEPKFLRKALLSFLVNVAYLNLYENEKEENYSMLVHTSGKKVDHSEDYKQIVKALNALKDEDNSKYETYLKSLWEIARGRYEGKEDSITKYVRNNIGRNNIVVMNSNTAKAAAEYKSATSPASLFTIAIGGNIVSRGVTFDNLLSMFFTRDVKHKIQQDTYIQRARMFGTRGSYLKYFELHIPDQLYLNWQKCFVFHRLALSAIRSGQGSPVWLEDRKVSAASSSSINKTTVVLESGEMSWQIFSYAPGIDEGLKKDLSSTQKLALLKSLVDDSCLPEYVIDFIRDFSPYGAESLAIHSTQTIDKYESADVENIQRRKGFISSEYLERQKYPRAIHHIKVIKNNQGRARFFYKYAPDVGNIRFLRNRRAR